MKNRDSPFVYICSPYSGDIAGNTERARRYCRFAFENGKIPIAPHIYLPQFMAEETEREAALATGFRFLDICAEIWGCGDRISEGMEREIAHAESAGIPVRYIGGVSCTRLKKD